MNIKKIKSRIQLALLIIVFFGLLISKIVQHFRQIVPSSESSESSEPQNSTIEKIVWPTPIASGEKEEVAPVLTRKNYYVILDGSGSMQEVSCSDGYTKEQVAKEAVKEFAKKLPDEDNLGLLIFDNYGTTERIPLGTNNREDFIYKVSNSSADGGTPIKSAIRMGIEKLGIEARRQLGYGEFHLVIVTDGEADDQEDPTRVVTFALAETPIIIHTVGFCIGQNHSLNQPGKTLYKSAKDKESLNEGLDDVLAESENFDISSFKEL